MKKIITLTLILALTLTLFSGCGGVNSLKKPEMPPYPEIESGSGYYVHGFALDKFNQPLEGVEFKIADKVRAISDSKGYYKITSLTGANVVEPSFYGYTFSDKAFTVTGNSEKSVLGTTNFGIRVSATTSSGSPLYGVTYVINGQGKNDDKKGNFFDSMQGRTVVRPQKEGFTFVPEEKVVFSGGEVSFQAVPNANTYSVSGIIDISNIGTEEAIDVPTIYVDGKMWSGAYLTYSHTQSGSQRVMKYEVQGLNPSKAGGYKISLVDSQGNVSREIYQVTEARDDLNFMLQVTKNFGLVVTLDNLNSIDPEGAGNFNTMTDRADFDIFVQDAQGNIVHKYYGRDIEIDIDEDGKMELYLGRDEITVWEGCKVVIEGTYEFIKTIGSKPTIVKYIFEEWDTITNSDMKSEDKYIEIGCFLEEFVPEEEDDE